ncbi:alpha/beta fold hydrolase [Streptomyces goshikiensis]
MSARPLPEATFARTVLGSGPGLALAHGAGSSVDQTYGPILEGLAAGHKVVGVDYPGSGGTPRSTAPLSLDDLADQLVAAAVAEGLETFAVSGYSLGGPVAIRAAARHPERVTALVLTATFARPDNRLALSAPIWGKLAETDQELLAQFLVMMATGADALGAMAPEQLRQAVAYTAAGIAEGSPDHAELVDRIDVREDLAHIAVPPWSSPPPRTGSPPRACTTTSPRTSPEPGSWRSPPATCRWWSARANGRSSSPTSWHSTPPDHGPSRSDRDGR